MPSSFAEFGPLIDRFLIDRPMKNCPLLQIFENFVHFCRCFDNFFTEIELNPILIKLSELNWTLNLINILSIKFSPISSVNSHLSVDLSMLFQCLCEQSAGARHAVLVEMHHKMVFLHSGFRYCVVANDSKISIWIISFSMSLN